MEKHLFYYTSHSQFFNPVNRPSVSYCELEDEVHYHPDPFNGHEYVDLGLPSGTLWAKCNVGANSETDYGLYFAWGETTGYTASQVSGSATPHKDFSWNDYALTEDSGATMSKYNATDSKTVLDAEDDAASVNMGGEWHMPTKEQYEELLNIEYVTNAWITNYQDSGINGRLFTSVSNGNTLFIPAAGYYGEGYANYEAAICYAWSSTLDVGSEGISAYFLSFYNRGTSIGGDLRSFGYSVRGVILGPVKYTYSIGFLTKDDNELYSSLSLNRIPTLSESTSLMRLCNLTYDNLQKVILTFEDGTVVSSEGKNPKNYIKWSSSRSLSLLHPLFTWLASIFPNNFNMPEQVKAQSVTIEVYI